MELFGLAFAAIIGVVVSPIFCFGIAKDLRLNPLQAKQVLYPSIVFVILYLIDFILVFNLGSLRTRELVGSIYSGLHAILSLGFAPALASILLLCPRNINKFWIIVVAIVC